MKWKKFTIETTVAAVDFISEELLELGIDGIEIEDHVPLTESETKGMFIDILPELPPDDGSAKVSFYLPGDKETAETAFNGGDAPHMGCTLLDHEQVLEQVKAALEEVRLFVEAGSLALQESETEETDWMNNWKEFFHPFAVGNILIKPTWEEIPEEHQEKLCITIDPGSAFGTGTHETTQLCLSALQKYLRTGDLVLDVGTGSGILAIAALKLGAKSAFGTELDESAVATALENAAQNDVSQEAFKVICGNLIGEKAIQDAAGYEIYDVAVANILAPVIILLMDEMGRHMKPGGIWITSGILDTKEDEVKEAFAAHPEFEVLETCRQGEWVSVVVRKKEKNL
ncbi:50S ribosomal protein L11 methyltransferase [Hominifimenecus sp. rT4P-3]|uniref:50S ribosomal protein L11 methyltransferase n=1 Tax=Hominifimenecus sp. rT4P-3 TaxID=3242979 RepID=UPI003DA222B4